MAWAGMQGELTSLCAETYGICMATSCPSGPNKNEAENLLKSKDRNRWFPKNEAENILKISQLKKVMGTQNLGDNLAVYVGANILPSPETGSEGRVRALALIDGRLPVTSRNPMVAHGVRRPPLDCGSSSYRLPCSHHSRMNQRRKAVAAATALHQSTPGTRFVAASSSRRIVAALYERRRRS